MKMIFKNIGSIYTSEGTDIFRFQRWGYFLAAAILAAWCAATTYRLFNVPQYYSELIVGNIAWKFSNKFHDYAVLFSLVGGFFFALIVLSLLSKRLTEKVGPDAEDRFHDFLVLLSTPAGVWFAGLMVTQNDSLSLLTFSSNLLLIGVIFVYFLTRQSGSFWHNDAAQFFRVLHAIFLALLAFGFAALAISVGANRIGAFLNVEHFIDSRYAYQFTIVSPLVFVILAVGFIFTSRSSNHLELLLRRSIFLLQIFFPVFFLLLIPTPWLMDNNRLVIGYPLSDLAWVVIFLCIVAAYVDLYRRYNLNRSSSITNPVNLFSLFCVIGVLLFLNPRRFMGRR